VCHFLAFCHFGSLEKNIVVSSIDSQRRITIVDSRRPDKAKENPRETLQGITGAKTNRLFASLLLVKAILANSPNEWELFL
jgi:hypothetical protein